MARKAQIGDILEIPTKLGNAYVQFSHYHEIPPKMGAVIRLLPGFFSKRPSEFQQLANQKEIFYTLFPVQAAITRGIFPVVGHAELPDFARSFPLFRNGVVNPATGKVEQWWFWDGVKSWKVGQLTDAQLDLPIESGWNDTMLIQRIEQGWTPRNAEYFVAAARAKKRTPDAQFITLIRHYLRLERRADADIAIRRAGELDVTSEIQDHDGKWMVIVHQNRIVPEERERVRAYLSDVAAALGGKYDGWEFKIGGETDEPASQP